ncbi:BadF/BadG/BcrA/BcrD ATPase family protein [Paenibacillus sp. S-12]|uniref:N-acetylglucosamine kinase n=1 Tax=Paenibacillus sp. S-12 TaxID=3031371 RepID=UPI0025A0AA6C|nr:BadF/BadG/BcrA/BcrD ATPase family protein [Paenibacillus sp. S-12]
METYRIPLLAVDGGGTKCLVRLLDREGTVLGQGKGGSSNYQGVGGDEVIRALSHGIEAALHDYCRRHEYRMSYEAVAIDCAVFALAGLDTEHDRQIITGLVQSVLNKLSLEADHVIVENDGYAALLGATGGEPGVLVIAGTGSIIFGVNDDGQTARAGGWGHRVGDEGSGYWIGKEAIRTILKSYDGRETSTGLGEWILLHLGVNNEEELFNWTYSKEYSIDKVSELAEIVNRAAVAGNREASQILVAAADELFQGAAAVINHLSLLNTRFTMVLQGGVLRHEGHVRNRLMHKIEAYAPKVSFHEASREPIDGVTAMGISYLQKKMPARS